MIGLAVNLLLQLHYVGQFDRIVFTAMDKLIESGEDVSAN